MPNPCGVGMALVENQSKDEKGQVVKSTVVGGMQGGLAADLSGVVKIGDELIQVFNKNNLLMAVDENGL